MKTAVETRTGQQESGVMATPARSVTYKDAGGRWPAIPPQHN